MCRKKRKKKLNHKLAFKITSQTAMATHTASAAPAAPCKFLSEEKT